MTQAEPQLLAVPASRSSFLHRRMIHKKPDIYIVWVISQLPMYCFTVFTIRWNKGPASDCTCTKNTTFRRWQEARYISLLDKNLESIILEISHLDSIRAATLKFHDMSRAGKILKKLINVKSIVKWLHFNDFNVLLYYGNKRWELLAMCEGVA